MVKTHLPCTTDEETKLLNCIVQETEELIKIFSFDVRRSSLKAAVR